MGKVKLLKEMTPSERESALKELAEKNENPWIPSCDASEAGYSHIIAKLAYGDDYRYQISAWEPRTSFFPIVWGDSVPRVGPRLAIETNIRYPDSRIVAYKPDDGSVEKFLEESGYYDDLYNGMKVGLTT